MSMGEYANDPIRWGTAGGAPRTDIQGKQNRTKWAWALGRIIGGDGRFRDDVDLYDELMKTPNVAHVALKEEPTKTRPVVTTPMASYVRQAYLLFRRGGLRVPSPIGKGDWLGQFQSNNYAWYGCLDGEKFDTCIPKSVAIKFVRAMGDLDDETR